MPPTFKKVAVTLAVVGLAATASLAAPSAYADSGAPSPAQIEKAVTSKTPVKVGLNFSTAASSNTAARTAGTVGCYGQTHNPHRSYSFASVHGDTNCPVRASMIVSINLSRDRWWGWQHLNNGYKSGYSYKVDGNVKWYCSGTGTYTYRGVSYHRATVGGRNYIGYTSNQDRFSC